MVGKNEFDTDYLYRDLTSLSGEDLNELIEKIRDRQSFIENSMTPQFGGDPVTNLSLFSLILTEKHNRQSNRLIKITILVSGCSVLTAAASVIVAMMGLWHV